MKNIIKDIVLCVKFCFNSGKAFTEIFKILPGYGKKCMRGLVDSNRTKQQSTVTVVPQIWTAVDANVYVLFSGKSSVDWP